MQRKYFTPQRETENSNTNKGLHIIRVALTVNWKLGLTYVQKSISVIDNPEGLSSSFHILKYVYITIHIYSDIKQREKSI